MRADTLKRLGKATWGQGWAFELALALGRHPVTVRRWQAGITHMSTADHRAVLKAAMEHSRQRHNAVQQIVLGVKTRDIPTASRRKLRKRVETPMQRYRKLAQGSGLKRLS